MNGAKSHLILSFQRIIKHGTKKTTNFECIILPYPLEVSARLLTSPFFPLPLILDVSQLKQG